MTSATDDLLLLGLFERDGIKSEFFLPSSIGTQTLAVVGIRGSGKTVTASVIVESLLEEKQQVIILDPTDVWWGLKSSADGMDPAYPIVVFGGPHGDLPLEPGSGPALADFAVEQRASMILSLRHLRKGQQQTLVTAFAEQLYHRKGEAKNRTPVLVVIDEASTFVPQKVMGESARLVGSIEDLVRKGRASGIGVMLIDQRPASVNKDVLTQLEVLVAHQITAPHDRKALLEWVRQHDTHGGEKAFLEQLSSLPTGTAWFWSPSLNVFDRVSVRMRHTFDSSKTPKPGDVAAAPAAVAEIDLEALRTQLDSAIAEAENNDPKALRRRIAELEAAGGAAMGNWRERAVTAEAKLLRVDLARREMSFAKAAARIALVRLNELETLLDGVGDLLGKDNAPTFDPAHQFGAEDPFCATDRLELDEGFDYLNGVRIDPGSIEEDPTAPTSSGGKDRAEGKDGGRKERQRSGSRLQLIAVRSKDFGRGRKVSFLRDAGGLIRFPWQSSPAIDREADGSTT